MEEAAGGDVSEDPLELLDQWMERHKPALERYRQSLVDIRAASSEVGVLLVASRELRTLIARTSP